jgi:putative ABC transport system substrate-binding protein
MMFFLRRRDFIAATGSAAAWPVIARAQQAAVPVIGWIGNYAPGNELQLTPFRKGLMETGYAEGRNVRIEYRWVENRNDRLPALLRDLIDRRVAVLAPIVSTAAAVAAKAATQTIPIVFRIGGDPVAAGLVTRLNQPGGNITGTTTLGVELGPKRLEMLRELSPFCPIRPTPTLRVKHQKFRPRHSSWACACWSWMRPAQPIWTLPLRA